MATKIIFRYDDMSEVATKISEISQEYQTAGTTLIAALNEATASWEGASKDKFDTLINTGTKSVNGYVTQTIPTVIQGLSDMLQSNATQMQGADNNIAGQLSDSL